jgi:hypothetical protein
MRVRGYVKRTWGFLIFGRIVHCTVVILRIIAPPTLCFVNNGNLSARKSGGGVGGQPLTSGSDQLTSPLPPPKPILSSKTALNHYSESRCIAEVVRLSHKLRTFLFRHAGTIVYSIR